MSDAGKILKIARFASKELGVKELFIAETIVELLSHEKREKYNQHFHKYTDGSLLVIDYMGSSIYEKLESIADERLAKIELENKPTIMFALDRAKSGANFYKEVMNDLGAFYFEFQYVDGSKLTIDMHGFCKTENDSFQICKVRF